MLSCVFVSFQQMLLPCEDNFLRNVTLDRHAQRVGRYDFLPQDIERAMLDILEQELALQAHLEDLKRDLELRYDYSPIAAYRSIDRYNDGVINANNLGAFLRTCGHFAAELELHQIVRRMDSNGDGCLSYQEFAEFLRPNVPVVRSSYSPRQKFERHGSPMSPLRSTMKASQSF